MSDRYTSEDYKIGTLKPITNPIELKQATIRDYKRNYDRQGVNLSNSLLERMAVNDLELVAAHKRGQDASPSYKSKSPPKKRDAASDVAMKALEATGHKMSVRQRRPATRKSKGILNVPADQIDEKWMYMSGRLKRIAAGACANPDRRISLSTCENPKLAERIYQAQMHFMFRHRNHKSNPFRTMAGGILNERDAFRKLRRILEDICDESAGFGNLGPWFVPK